ncbi:MAG TPA: endonuclease domain-containing protein [Allosphingosinicella sp.]
MRSTTPATVAKARTLRRTMTKPEAALWQILRTRPAALKFRRQHPVGRFVLDFYCPAAKMAVEVDGMAHEMGDNPARDERRDRWLNGQGFRILRVPAAEVLTNIEGVTAVIVDTALSSLSRSDGEGNHAKHGGGAKDAGDPCK